MHIPDGVLSQPVLVATTGLAAAGVGVGVWRMDAEQVPRVGLMASAFFVASLVHVPIGPSSVHLVLVGLMGIVLGWSALPALAVALALQAVQFGFGGLTSLGANVLIMGLPAVACHYAFGGAIRRARDERFAVVLGFGAGAAGVGASCLVNAGVLLFAGRAFAVAAGVLAAAHLLVMVIEGFVTAAGVSFLRRVRPELLGPTMEKESGDA